MQNADTNNNKDKKMKKMVYVAPTVEIEVLACEQGFALSSNFEVEDGKYNDEEYWA